MPKKTEDTSVVFTDGFVFNRDFIAVSSYLQAYEDSDHARIFTLTDGEWNAFDLDFNVRSIQGIMRPNAILYCMGADGRISIQKKGPSEEKIKDAGSGDGELGYLHQIRVIDSTLYVCGVGNQIYRRGKSGWVHHDDGVLDKKGAEKKNTLFSIDGASEDNIYTVGKGGQVWHFGGKAWRKIESPTAKNLNWVRCPSEDEVYACGDAGFFQRTKNGWTTFPALKATGDLWCVEVFQEKVYVAADTGLFVLQDKKLNKVAADFDFGEGHRLHANDEVLWYFGVDKLCFFDGKKWTYVKHPDNPE